MKVLLDTHLLLWALYQPSKLPAQAREKLLDPRSSFVYSVVTLWEVQIKHQKNPILMPPSAQELYGDCTGAGLGYLILRPKHVFGLEALHQIPGAKVPRDPFDRLLLAQAKADGFMLLTHDAALSTYGEPCVLLV